MAARASAWVVIGALSAWLGLAVFNLFALLAFGGWVGAADAFIPWSILAALLWHLSREPLGFQLLRRTWPGRIVLVLWFTLLLLAAAGIDERPWAPPAQAVTITYLLLPTLPMFLLLAALLARRTRKGTAA
jgi:hypothetical protein